MDIGNAFLVIRWVRWVPEQEYGRCFVGVTNQVKYMNGEIAKEQLLLNLLSNKCVILYVL